ncbi:MAG: hypothetical protein ACD_47C00306G0001, partial [uncultured bacterium]
GGEEPTPDCYRKALRDIAGHCIYGVDLNPMAVELCKVNLWMEALEPGKPLSFLEHHIKCGSSLVGATPKLLYGAPKKYVNGKYELYEGGIPDDAFNTIEGDDKKYCSELKKLNKSQKDGAQKDLFDDGGAAVSNELSNKYENLDNSDDSDLGHVREKSRKYDEILNSFDYIHERMICDAWCSAFVWNKSKIGGAANIPMTNALLTRIRDNFKNVDVAILNEIKRLRDQYKFFHWHIEFPDVFRPAAPGVKAENEEMGWNGGFDCVLGNPPWEQLQLDPQEFFAVFSTEIANAANMAVRERKISQLKDLNPKLYSQYTEALRIMEGVQHFVHNSSRFPLTSFGRLNTAPLFVELSQTLISTIGRVGIIVPSGIATDSFNQHYFKAIVEQGRLVSLYDFENRQKLFQAVDSRMKFSLLTLTGLERPSKSGADFAFFLYQTEDLSDPEKIFKLSKEDIELINPNTRTCPVFRTRRDAEITKAICRRVPVLVNENKVGGNPWGFDGMLMFMMNTASHMFRTRTQLEAEGWHLIGNVFHSPSHARNGGKVEGDGSAAPQCYLPLYEAKMVHHYDHRWATYINGTDTRDLTLEEKATPNFQILPRYWVPKTEVAERLKDRWSHGWLLGWRDITNTTNERTVIAGVISRVGVGNQFPLMLLNSNPINIAALSANLTSFAFDFVARQKCGGSHLNFFVYKQLPIILPNTYTQFCFWSHSQTIADWICQRVLELTYTAYDLKPFALDCGYDGPPFKWDEERRFLIRCELDAAYFHLYEISRDEVDYIMDTFPITQRKDQDKYGCFRTKKVILEIFDEMAEAIKTGKAYQTRLEPAPGDLRAGHEK